MSRADLDYDDADFQMLHNLHTGHYWYGLKSPENSRANSPSPSEGDDENRPPFLPFKQLTNLLVVDDSGEVQPYNPPSKVQSPGPITRPTIKSKELQKQEVQTPTTIAKKLAALITKDYCHLCKFNTLTYIKHYRNPGHYIKVRQWIERELTNIKEPVGLLLMFCEVCNLPLSGNEKARSHYLEQEHKNKEKSFCTLCQRMIDAADMTSHKKSKQHAKKLQAVQNGAAKQTLQIKAKAPKNVPTIRSFEAESPIYPNALKEPIVSETETSNEQPANGLKVENKEEAIKIIPEETFNLTSLELQRLVMLEQLELLRILKEKEMIILNRLRRETIKNII